MCKIYYGNDKDGAIHLDILVLHELKRGYKMLDIINTIKEQHVCFWTVNHTLLNLIPNEIEIDIVYYFDISTKEEVLLKTNKRICEKLSHRRIGNLGDILHESFEVYSILYK